MSVKHLAEYLEVSSTTVWRWAKAANISMYTQKRGGGGQMVPLRALLSYLATAKKLPFNQVEKNAYNAIENL